MSIIKANAWQKVDGTPVQSILKVYHSRYPSTAVSFSNTSWNDLDSITVVPSSASSRFLLIPSYHISGQGGLKIVKNGADLTFGNPQDGNGPYQSYTSAAQGDWNSGSIRHFSTFMYIDSPATLSPITYKTQIKSYIGGAGSGRIGVNEVGGGGTTSATALHSGFTIMEIAA